jgi:RNA polymerase-interacting CarD/CdnL/TRCF family regulator
MEEIDPLQTLWDSLLSRQPEKVRRAFATLDRQSKKNVVDHLKRMVNEKDWHPEQKKSAQAALRALRNELQGM